MIMMLVGVLYFRGKHRFCSCQASQRSSQEEHRALQAKQREERRVLREKQREERRRQREEQRKLRHMARLKKRSEALEDIKTFIKKIIAQDKDFVGYASLTIEHDNNSVSYTNNNGKIERKGSDRDIERLVRTMVDDDNDFTGQGSLEIVVTHKKTGKNIDYKNNGGVVCVKYHVSDERGNYSLCSEGTSINSMTCTIKSIFRAIGNWFENLGKWFKSLF